MRNTRIALQLYSVRDFMKVDFEETLKKVSLLGYTGVEFGGFFDKSSETVKNLLKKYNLNVIGSHSLINDLIDNYDETVAFHKVIGNKNYVIPGADLSCQEKIDKFVDLVVPLTEKLSTDGITLSFHNHANAFVLNPDGTLPYEQLIYRTKIMFEIDTFWAYIGMSNPIILMERLRERTNFIHIKDGLKDKTGKPLGLGETPIKDIYLKADEMGIPVIVESETLNPDGMTEAKICINYLLDIQKKY